MNKQDRIAVAVLGIALYLISTGLSFGAFSYFGKKIVSGTTAPPVLVNTDGGLQIDPAVPRTEECPINGKLFTKEERAIWEKRRPLAVMIENHVDARPQSGLASADIVYEAVAEGGITRFMGIFYCGISAKDTVLAPVRSARTPYLHWVLEYDALYVHVGGAGYCDDDTVDTRAKALCQIGQYKIKDMDQFGLPFSTKDANGKKVYVCKRNYERLGREIATEHTMECFTTGLYREAEVKRGWTNVDAKGISWDKNFVPWKFKDDAKTEDRGPLGSINFVAWKGWEKDFGVRWEYDPVTNSYKRIMGGVTHADLESKNQITASAVIVEFAKEIGPLGDHGHILYENIGSGDSLIFMDGKQIKATWKKPKRTDRTIYYDAKGTEIKLNRGQIWIEILPKGTPVNE